MSCVELCSNALFSLMKLENLDWLFLASKSRCLGDEGINLGIIRHKISVMARTH